MKIGILGSGNIGGTLGKKWAQAGHDVVFGVREVNSAKVGALLEAAGGNASADSVANAAAFGDVILIAIPWSAAGAMVEAHAEALNGKIVMDATNNFGGPVINNVEAISSNAPAARVYRAFNSLGWENFETPQIGETQVDLFYCGPDDEARPVVEGLIQEIGLRPIWVGDLDVVQIVDSIGLLWVSLIFGQGMGRHLAFKVLTP